MHDSSPPCMRKALKEAGVPTSVALPDARGLRGGGDKTRTGDIVVLDYHTPCRHLLRNDGIQEYQAEGDMRGPRINGEAG